ncbi:hypothetical protein OG799_17415 [Micromonospora sp. NBC_00898]|nr:hypothetical protein OG799_17415 [Micromonospora sp. NBC_00898]
MVGVHRSTISRSAAEIRPLPAQRGCLMHDGVRLRTVADVVGTWATTRGR